MKINFENLNQDTLLNLAEGLRDNPKINETYSSKEEIVDAILNLKDTLIVNFDENKLEEDLLNN